MLTRILKLVLLFGIFAAPAQAETRVIAMLGDSLTQGFGLKVEDGLVPTLERWLHHHGADVRLINAGVSGDTTAGGAARIDWTLTPDVDGVVVALGANDMLRGLDPEDAIENLAKILSVAQAKGVSTMLVGFPAPLNYGEDYKLIFDEGYANLASKFSAVFVKDLIGPLQTPEGPNTDYLQSDLLHPNPKGVTLIVEQLGPRMMELLQNIQP